jgi:IS1 family transposase/transposase-like protein
MDSCPYCQGRIKRHGRDQRGFQRVKCLACGRTSADRPAGLFPGFHVPEDGALLALGMLADGNSLRGVERLTGIHRDTALRLQAHAGRKLYLHMDKVVRDLEIQQLQCDEVWTYARKHDRRLTTEERLNDELGSQFIFLALDPKSKFIPSFEVGKRTEDTATAFMLDLRRRVKGNPCLFTDGFSPYVSAVCTAFGRRVGFAQVVKTFQAVPAARLESYRPARRVTTEKYHIQGEVEHEDISTSLIERFNATLRCQVKRLSRLTLAYTKKLDNLVYNLALYLAVYNWTRIPRTLRCTPAMAIGLARKPLSLRELLEAAA